jgi:hypothetical protein
MSQNEWIKGPEPLSEFFPDTSKRFRRKVARTLISETARSLGVPDPYEPAVVKTTKILPSKSNQRMHKRRIRTRAEKHK